MSFTSMHNDHLDPDIHDAQPEPPCEDCRWDNGGECRLTVACLFEPRSDINPSKPSALDVQVSGSHYKDMAIQPAVFIHKNRIEFLPGCVIKRMCRWRKKDGIKDLEKAIHEIQLMIEMES